MTQMRLGDATREDPAIAIWPRTIIVPRSVLVGALHDSVWGDKLRPLFRSNWLWRFLHARSRDFRCVSVARVAQRRWLGSLVFRRRSNRGV